MAAIAIILFIVALWLGFKYDAKLTKKFLFAGGIIVIVLIVVSVYQSNRITTTTTTTSYSLPKNTPTPTINPNASWHTILTKTGGNGDSSTETFAIKGNEWRIDYETTNSNYGLASLDITPLAVGNNSYGVGNIPLIFGIANNSVVEHGQPGNYYLNINSNNQNYTIKIEDYY